MSDQSETAEVTTGAAPADEEPLIAAKQVAEISLVSNTAENQGTFAAVGKVTTGKVDYATSFHTGDNVDGYALTSVQLHINRDNSNAIPEVSIFSDSSGNVGTSLHTMDNPSPLPLHTDTATFALTTFTAPDDTTIAADTTYWLVAKAVNPGAGVFYRAGVTNSHHEASDDSPEWNIGNDIYGSEDGAAWAQITTAPTQMNIQGKLINPPGVVTITPEDAEVGTQLTASLADDDGGITNVRWQWSRSNDGETGWTNISRATTASYTPVYIDQGEYLRATASYSDDHGTGKTASGVIEGPPALSLVSNTAESQETLTAIGVITTEEFNLATSFHTGDNPDGYTLTSVQLLVNRQNSNIMPELSIFTDSSGSVGTSLHTLSNPGTLPVHTIGTTLELTTFTAPDSTTLAADTTYWLVAEALDPANALEFYRIGLTNSDDEASDESTQWNIGDVAHRSQDGGAWEHSRDSSIQMNIQGKLINPPGVVTILPEDAEVGTDLTASLPDDDGGATNVRWQWARSRSGQTGWTNISGARTNTYTPVYGDRGEYLRASASYNTPELAKTASGIIKGPPALGLVSNTGEEQAGSLTVGVNIGELDFNYATSFHTGDHAEGYAFTSVQLLVNRTDIEVIPLISILSDNSGAPGTSLHTLTNPRPLPLHEDAMTFELMTFAAPSNITLAADTTYWMSVTATDDGSVRIYRAGTTESDNEISSDSPEWEIGDVTHQTTDGSTWTQGSVKSILMTIQGRLINPPGVVTITPEDANIGTELTASLESPYRGVTSVTWQWSRSGDGKSGWTRISGAGTNTYTPIYANRGEYLRATASYNDNHGTGKTASGIIEGPPALAFVSNLKKTSGGALSVFATTYYAVSFRTGNHDQGYAISGVTMNLQLFGDNFHQRISIFNDSTGNPGTSLYSITSTRELSATLQAETFAFPSGTTLEPNTTYWIVAQLVDNGNYRVSYTTDVAEDPTPFPGWSIGDRGKTHNIFWADYSQEATFQVGIAGRLINPRGVITFDQPRPNIDNLLSATFTDEDGGITDLRWQWSRSDNGQTGWTNISGANSAAYTPVEADAGKYLRAVANYTDNHGSGQRAEAVSQQPVYSFRIDFTIDPGMFAYEFHATEYEPLGDFRFQWKSPDVTGPGDAPWPTYDQFKPTHDVENFCAMPGITRDGAMECGWEYVSPGSGVSSQLATLVTKHANREYDFRIVGELREGGELFSSTIRTMVAPDPDLSDATERGIKAWRVDTAGHFIVEWRLTQSCDAGKRFYIRTEDSGKFAWGTGGRNQHGRLLFADNATFDEDENDVATEVFIYCATSREDTNQGHIYAAADIAAKGADPVLGTEATR